jgi:Zn-dependent M28 family amino/carboxypeptidase
MTYYGRWTYKYEEAARKGAAGVIVIHSTIPAGYPWGVVEGGWSGPQLNLENENGNMDRCAVEGWVSFESTQKIFELAGVEMSVMDDAKRPGFKAVPLNVNASVAFSNSIKRSTSQNVIATYPGTEKSDEHIILTAHWDHLGVGKVVDGDSIYNGAVDNASGTACLMEITKAFAVGKVETKRSVTFLAVTAEEQGLLGSAWYSDNPIIEPAKTIANINMDALNPNGPMKDLTVIGYGQSELEDIALPFVKAQGRYILPDQEPGKGFFFRSDHFSFAKIGIPAFYAKGGYDHAEKGKEYAEESRMDYLTNKYHKPQDEVDTASIDLRGMVQDAQLYFEISRKLATEDIYPEWKEGSEFKDIREKSLRPNNP